ncbi:MAG: hypothetical protein AAFX81_14430 [Pseudomonadota bacterium]
MRRVLLAAVGAVGLHAAMAGPTVAAVLSVPATDAYYEFRGNVSSNSDTRLLAGKATAIGFPGQDAISFIGFDRADLPSAVPSGGRALLKLQQDASLAPTLIRATNASPVSLGAYGFDNPPGTTFDPSFDRVGGNGFDVNYGPEGSNVVSTVLVGDDGVYTWDVTSLVNAWLGDPTAATALAISGIYGNVGGDGRNAYGIFHTVGSTAGVGPELHVTPIPGALPLLLTGTIGLAWLRQRRRLTRA